jgi:hypothetical protein
MVANTLSKRLRPAPRVQHLRFAPFGFACLLTLIGCSESEGDVGMERVSVAGQVTLDGRPLQAGAIMFCDPLGVDQQPTVRAYGFIENGRFRIDADRGPVVGTAQILFRPQPLNRETFEAALDQPSKRSPLSVVEIPEHYVEAPFFEVKLVSGIDNELNFELKSQP